MKNLKRVVALACLMLASAVLQSQNQNSSNTQYLLFKNIEIDSLDTLYKPNLKNIFLKSRTFSTYNPNTNWNDHYTVTNQTYVYRKSSLLIENNFRQQKIDSYNPYGSPDVNSALILGVVGEFLRKVQR